MEENTATPEPTLAERYNDKATIILKDEKYGQETTYEEVNAYTVEGRTDRLARYSNELRNLNDNVEKVKKVVLTALEDETIEEEVAQDIARLLKFELTREVRVMVNVSFDLTVNLAVGEDLDEFIRDLNFEVTGAYGTDSEIASEDYSIDGWDEQ
jgi:hypothetical protein